MRGLFRGVTLLRGFTLVWVVWGALALDKCSDLARIKIKCQWGGAYSTGMHRDDFANAVWKAYVYYATYRCIIGN